MALSLGSVPVSATISRAGPLRPQLYDDVRWDCGYPMEVKGETRTRSGSVTTGRSTGSSTRRDNYAFKETWTAGATGARSGCRPIP